MVCHVIHIIKFKNLLILGTQGKTHDNTTDITKCISLAKTEKTKHFCRGLDNICSLS